MAAQTETSDEVLRHARECARIVLAKHPCVTGGAGNSVVLVDVQAEIDRLRIGHEGQNIVGGQDATGAGGSQ